MTLRARLDPLPDLPHAGERSLGLDVLRALAILLVMVSHYANNIGFWFHLHTPQRVLFLGEVGVMLFFALSGFLIGRILIRIAETQPSLRNLGIFLVRRWMRTLPLYFLWLGVLFWLWPPAHDAAAHGWRFATLTQNLLTPMPADYFFGVSWSLTIEEWFYLLFASALILCTRWLGRGSPALWLCLATFMLGPLALRLSEFTLTDTNVGLRTEVFFRIDAIAYGVLMAWLYTRRNWAVRHPWPLLALGLASIAAAWTLRMPVPIELIPALFFNATIIGCALCLPAALRLGRAPAWFATPVRLISAQSYGLYVMHETILVDFCQNQLWGPGRLSAPAAALVAVVLPFVLSYLSFRWFEAPILRLRPRQHLAATPVVRASAPA